MIQNIKKCAFEGVLPSLSVLILQKLSKKYRTPHKYTI
jgi:hypothetical protein